jgi:hypothetical protein
LIIRKTLFIAVTTAFFTICLGAESKIDSGLVAYYPFNGNANDESGNENHGVVYGAILTKDKHGENNKSYKFDGINDYISIPFSSDFDFSDEEQISFGLWIFLLSTKNTEGALIFKDATCTQFAFCIQINSNVILDGGIHASGCWIKLKTPIATYQKRWTHIFITANNKYLNLYVNGRKIGECAVYDPKWENTYRGDLYIGEQKVGILRDLNKHVSTIIDEVRIYNRCLNELEVLALYESEK